MKADSLSQAPSRLPFLTRLLAMLGVVCVLTNSFYFWWKRNHPATMPSVNNSAAVRAAATAEDSHSSVLTPPMAALAEQQEQWLLLHPADVAVHLKLAQLYTEAGQNTPALNHLLSAQSFQPRNAAIAEQLASAYMQNHQLPEAKSAAEQTLRLAPRNLAARELLGQIYLAQDQYQKALQTFNQCLSQNSKSFEARFGQAKSMEQLYLQSRNGTSQGFIQAASQAVQLQPDNVPALCTLARMLFAYQGQLERGEKLARRAIALNPNFAEPHLILVEIYLHQPTPQHLDQALTLAQQAAQLDSTQPEPLYLLARVQMQKGQTRAAIASLEQSLLRRPMPQAVYLLSQAYARVGDVEKAHQYSASYKQWNDFSEKRKVLLGQLRHQPRDVNLYCDVGQLYINQHNYEAAANWLHRAQQLQPTSTRVRQLLAALDTQKAGAATAPAVVPAPATP